MVETSNRQLSHVQVTISTPRSTTDARAAIRDTRARLAARLTDASERIGVMLTHPTREAEGDGPVGTVLHTLATIRRASDTWKHARSVGIFRRAAVAALAAGIALVLAVKTRHA